MSADLHIHIKTPDLTEEDFKCFFSSCLGRKWFEFGYKCPEELERDELLAELRDTIQAQFPDDSGKWYGDSPKAKAWTQAYSKFLEDHSYSCSHDDKIYHTPNIWVGEVSWLKAALFEDSDTFVPDAIQGIVELIGEEEIKLIDDQFIEDVKRVMGLPNNTVKEDGVWSGSGYSLSSGEKVVAFLEQYKGMECFTISH